ncbi:MAG: hypothetical protein ABI613_07110 [Gemmatimonadota bacterium]
MICRLVRRGELLAENVECRMNLDHRRADGTPGWRGEAWVPTDVVILPGDRLTIETGEGTQADIAIERIVVDGSAGRMLVRFTGSTPLGPGDLESA